MNIELLTQYFLTAYRGGDVDGQHFDALPAEASTDQVVAAMAAAMVLFFGKYPPGGGVGTDELVTVSADDTTPGRLGTKLAAGNRVTLTEQNGGGDEALQIAMDDAGLVNDWKLLVKNDQFSEPGYLEDKLLEDVFGDEAGVELAPLSNPGGHALMVRLEDEGHAIAGIKHAASTLAQLNAKITGSDLDAAGTPRPPTAHALGGAEHTASTLAALNSKVSDATLDDAGDTRPPDDHGLGGGAHTAATLAELNALISDATLDDVGDPRDPNVHTLGGSKHLSSSLVSLNSKISDADVAAWTTGTWTPTFVVQVAPGASVGPYSLQSGVWRRIGDWVHVWGIVAADVDTSGGTLGQSAGPLLVGGLPFPALENTWLPALVQAGNNLIAAAASGRIFGLIPAVTPAPDQIVLTHDGIDIEGGDGVWDYQGSATVVVSMAYIAAPDP